MKVLILGANSLIARNFAEIVADKDKAEIYLGSRNEEELDRFGKHLQVKYGVPVYWKRFDATDYESHERYINNVISMMGFIDVLLIAFGYLGDHQKAVDEFPEARKIIETNYLGAVSVITHIQRHMRERKSGTIIGISSVAGDRGRKSNFIYGSAKAGLSEYLSGLRGWLYPYGVHVMTVKPGFVRTPMTEGMELPKLLTADPRKVAWDIYKGMKKRKDVIYTPFYWKWIMAIIKHMPEGLFKKLNI